MGLLIEGFWAEESTPFVRRMILDEVGGKRTGATRWDFNIFGLTLDFDAATATVEDLLEAGQKETVELSVFVEAAAAFGDDPSEGDGLTEAERHPPTYAADAMGAVEHLDEDQP